jgi:glutamyl-tRNA reductase
MRYYISNLNNSRWWQECLWQGQNLPPISAKKDQNITEEILLSTCARSVIYVRIQNEKELNIEH